MMKLNEVGAAVNSHPRYNNAFKTNYSKNSLICHNDALKNDDGKGAELKLFQKMQKMGLNKSMINEKIEWLVDGSIPRCSLGMIYGEAGTGKSFAAFYLARHLKLQRKVKRVIYIDCDNPITVIAQRGIYELIENRSTTFKYIVANHKKFEYRSVLEFLKELANSNFEKNKLLKNSLIIIDSIRDILEGRDMNSDADIIGVMDVLKKIRDDKQATLIFLHHKNKSGEFKGSGSFRDSVDWSFEIKNLNDNVQNEKATPNNPTLYIDFMLDKKRIAQHGFTLFIDPRIGKTILTDRSGKTAVEQTPVVVEKQVESNPQEQTIEQATKELQKELDQATDELNNETLQEKELKKAIADIFDEIL